MADTKFDLGQIVATNGALQALEQKEVALFLGRHRRGDWGDLCPQDKQLNDQAVKDGGRILSAYTSSTGVKVWVITEAVGDDGRRASTCILMPEEY